MPQYRTRQQPLHFFNLTSSISATPQEAQQDISMSLAALLSVLIIGVTLPPPDCGGRFDDCTMLSNESSKWKGRIFEVEEESAQHKHGAAEPTTALMEKKGRL